MAKTYEPIATQTLVSDSATVTFSNIPDTYTDLVIIGSGRSTRSAANDDIRMRFNDDTNNNYSATMIRGTGATADSARDTNQSYIGRLEVEADSATSDVFTSININLMSYSNTNVFKTVIGTSSASTSSIRKIAGLYRSTNSINTITLYALNGSLKSGSTFSLYGIKAKSPVVPLLTESTKTTSSVSAIIGNYDAGLTYTLASTAGTATRSGNTVTVSGLSGDQSITLTVTATDGNGSSSSNTISLISGPVATGGTITESGGFRFHTFTSSGTFVLGADKNVDYLVVAGGGAGGTGFAGGGGGGGGVLSSSSTLLTQGSYSITIGGGGGGTSNGSNSQINPTIVAVGGGRGGSPYINPGASAISGNPGGAGGGAGSPYSGSPAGSGTPGQGFNGGGGARNPSATVYSAGGGGGAGAVGGNGYVWPQAAPPPQPNGGGSGGAGFLWPINSSRYGGGGAGAVYGPGLFIILSPSTGGLGGGGNSGSSASNSTNGTSNTGGGGGGTTDGPGSTRRSGGSGIVVIRYAI